MGGIKDWISDHPYLAGGAVLSLVIIFVLLRGSNSSAAQPAAQSSGVAGTGLSSSDFASIQQAQLASSTQLAAQQTAATAQSNQLAAELQATQIQTAGQNYQAQLASQVALQNIVTSGQVQSGANTLSAQTAQAQIGGQVQVASIGAQENEYTTGMQAQVANEQTAAAVTEQANISAAQTAQAQANAQAQGYIAQLASNVSLAQIGSQNLQTTTEGDVALAQVGAENLQTTTTGQTQQASIAAQLTAYGESIPAIENLGNAEINSSNAQAYWANQTSQKNTQTVVTGNNINSGLGVLGTLFGSL